MASLKCLVSEERTSRPRAPLRPALPRQGGEGVCVAGSPTGLPSPQPTGRDPNARATPSPPLRGTLAPELPAARLPVSPRVIGTRRPSRSPRAQRLRGSGAAGGAEEMAATPARGKPPKPTCPQPRSVTTSTPAIPLAAVQPQSSGLGRRPPPPPSRRPASGSFPSAARGSSGAGSTAFSQNPAQAQGGELTAASARVCGAQRAGER